MSSVCTVCARVRELIIVYYGVHGETSGSGLDSSTNPKPNRNHDFNPECNPSPDHNPDTKHSLTPNLMLSLGGCDMTAA